MRVLFCAPYVPSSVRPRPLGFIKTLAGQGHSVTLLALDRRDPDPTSVRKYCENISLFQNHTSSAAMRASLALPTTKPLQVAYCDVAAMRRHVRQLVETGTFDLLHVEHLRLGEIVLGGNELPVVLDMVDALTALWQQLRHTGPRLKRVLARLEVPRLGRYEARVLKVPDLCLVSSMQDARLLARSDGAATVRLVPNTVEWAEFAGKRPAPKRGRIIFAGRMSYPPNISAARELAREVLPLVQRHEPSAELRIVGASPSREVLALARLPKVTVTGFVPDLKVEYGQAAVSVCNVAVAGGTQNKILESLAAGVPLVTTAKTAMGLGLTGGTDVLIANNPEEVADRVVALLNDVTFAARLGRAGQRFVSDRYNRESTEQNLLEAYQLAIEQFAIRHRNSSSVIPPLSNGRS
jgi:polysaccharide biosynthesis protein PslH